MLPVSLALLTSHAAAQEVVIRVEPASPLIERHDGRQQLNFDLAVHNSGPHTLRLVEIAVDILDAGGRLLERRIVNSNGLAPSIEIVAKPLVAPNETVDVFNPFFDLSPDLAINRMEYSFRYVREDNPQDRQANSRRLPTDSDLEVRASVRPTEYRPRTSLILPLRGRLFIWDSHDFYSHHRRVPLDLELVRKMGIIANPNRYASDLVAVDEQGRMFHDNPYNKKNYFVYGAAVYSPGDGTIVAAANNIPDNEFDGRQVRHPTLPPGADENLGNYVLIDHGNGEFSIFPHLMQGSVRVGPGKSVKRGQVLGRVGFSGDAIFPHVHYSLMSCRDLYRCEGLPAYFTQYGRVHGDKKSPITSDTIGSGELIESTARYDTADR
jgi:hypothetical protein